MRRFSEGQQRALRSALLIFLCFFLTSTGYLAWVYRLREYAPEQTDLYGMGLGYLFQALGVFSVSLAARFCPRRITPAALSGVVACCVGCLAFSVLCRDLWGAAAFGCAFNWFCGLISGYYLWDLFQNVELSLRGRVFGFGYGVATAATWGASLIGSGAVYRPLPMLVLCAVLGGGIVWIAFRSRGGAVGQSVRREDPSADRKTVLAAVAVTALFGLVNQIGFSAPLSPPGTGIPLELTRLLYGAGLILAGIVTDRSRRFGATLTLIALVFPFLTMILRGQAIPSGVVWSVAYFSSGFFSVYRVVVFADLADRLSAPWLACAGLFAGRIAESAGAMICYFFANCMIFWGTFAAVCYAVAVALFIWLYPRLYLPLADRESRERARFLRFAARHDLSSREREVLQLLLTGQSTGAIAEQLFVSESTVKFHVHNLLQKTGCRSRKELSEQYRADL